MAIRKLYHGSNVIVKRPRFNVGRPTHDFGQGFYLTSNFEQAKKWSRHKIRINPQFSKGNPYKFLVSEFLIDEKALLRISIKKFNAPDHEWLNYVVKNRKSLAFAKKRDYDLIVGPVVDGIGSWITLDKYFKKRITYKQTIEEISPENLKDQWVFKSQKSISLLKYGGVKYEKE